MFDDTKWHKRRGLLDEGAHVNCISERLAKAWRLKKIQRPAIEAKAFTTEKSLFVGTYVGELKVRDGEGRVYTSKQEFTRSRRSLATSLSVFPG